MTAREKELADIAEVMSYKINRRFMWRILDAAGINKSSFAIETPVMAFNEGQRNMGLMILADIMDACPDKYLLMTREAKEQENERRATEQHERDQRRANGELID
jgi:hypothetical protein